MSRKDLAVLPMAYESEAKWFKHIRTAVEDSNIFSKYELVRLLKLQEAYSQNMTNCLADQYSAYVTFIHEIIRDLERIKDITTSELPYEKITIWYRPREYVTYSIWDKPIYSEMVLKQYQELLILQKPKYKIPAMIESIETNEICFFLNATIAMDRNDLVQRGIHNYEVGKLYVILDQIQNHLKKPCAFALAVADVSRGVERQLGKVLEECVKDSKTVPRYVMRWENYIGTTREEKKRLYDRKLFEIIGLSVERVVKMLQEMDR